MELIALKTEPFPKEQLSNKLEEHGILINRYAEMFFAHPLFSTEQSIEAIVVVASLREIGLESGATLDEIFQAIREKGYAPCPASAGLFLRFAWKDQPMSRSSVLSGTHRAPDQAVTVLTAPFERNDDFPKGLYLRNVDGKLWLRGYICNAEHRFSGNDLIAFQESPV